MLKPILPYPKNRFLDSDVWGTDVWGKKISKEKIKKRDERGGDWMRMKGKWRIVEWSKTKSRNNIGIHWACACHGRRRVPICVAIWRIFRCPARSERVACPPASPKNRAHTAPPTLHNSHHLHDPTRPAIANPLFPTFLACPCPSLSPICLLAATHTRARTHVF